jgi:hypothetical protein
VGSIVFSPQTFACGDTVTIAATVRLPSSVAGTTTVTFYNDGTSETTFQVADRFSQEDDGSWLYVEPQSTGTFTCQSSGPTAVGKHSVSVKDASGTVLATGSYTVTP